MARIGATATTIIDGGIGRRTIIGCTTAITAGIAMATMVMRMAITAMVQGMDMAIATRIAVTMDTAATTPIAATMVAAMEPATVDTIPAQVLILVWAAA